MTDSILILTILRTDAVAVLEQYYRSEATTNASATSTPHAMPTTASTSTTTTENATTDNVATETVTIGKVIVASDDGSSNRSGRQPKRFPITDKHPMLPVFCAILELCFRLGLKGEPMCY